MRILCLNLHKECKASLAEVFLKFSPCVQYRSPNLIFIDITKSVPLFESEENILKQAIETAEELIGPANGAIANTTYTAQTFATMYEEFISSPADEVEQIKALAINCLKYFEGLKYWEKERNVEQVISQLYLLGLNKLGDLWRFDQTDFEERWGNLGRLLYRKIHGLEEQVISPLRPSEHILDYRYMDFPVSMLPLLMRQVEVSLKHLFARLQARALFAYKIQLRLYCEYSNAHHCLDLEPSTPNRNLELFTTLMENKLNGLNLENPIREYEIEVKSIPEKEHQLNFFEPQVRDEDRLQVLVSVLQQSSFQAGFFNMQDSILPEDSWSVRAEKSDFTPMETTYEEEGGALRVVPAYSEGLVEAPRPSRILSDPERLSPFEVRGMKFLTTTPIERLEDEWWDVHQERDYYFALSPAGQCLWIFQDTSSQEYFLHGYFD